MEAAGLSFTYASRVKPALVELSFEAEAGQTVLVLGPSGSGKSTLALCLDGLIPHLVEGDYEGRVVVAGLLVGDTPVHVLAQQTGLVFQDPESQFCTLTVADEIAFGLENLAWAPEKIDRTIDAALRSVGLEGYGSRHLATLSGGEKQRVALAAVLAMGPRVLVLDEPSANLDPRATAELFALLRSLASDRRHTIFIIEHKLDEIIDWVDSVLVLDGNGRLLYAGEPKQAFYVRGRQLSEAGVWLPQTVELVSSLRERGWPVPGDPLGFAETVAAVQATPGLVDRLENHDPGREDGRPVSGADGPPRAGLGTSIGERTESRVPLVQVRGLSYAYPGSSNGCRALTDISFTIEKGTFLAIAGRNGAGKSTLAGLLSGVLRAPAGTVFLEGEDISKMRAPAISDRIGHVFQNPEHQFVTETVAGELAFSLSPNAGRKGYRHLTGEQRRLVEEWLERLGLLPLAEASPFALSHGQKRRLSVAAMLIRGQSLLLLDEPTLGQDEAQAAKLMHMAEIFRAQGGTVVMITHDMRLVAEYADSLLVLASGRAAFAGSPAAFFSQPDLVESTGLAVPVLARLSAALLNRSGRPALMTVDSFLQAAAR